MQGRTTANSYHSDGQSESFQRLEEIANAGQKQSDELSRSLREVRIDAQRACEDQKEQLKKMKNSQDAIVIDTGAMRATVTKLLLLSEQSAATATSTEILKSLQFPLMHDRYSLIHERHPATFSWIFESAASPFKTWLEQDSGAFWISGKAGSGKSTLMKFLNQSPQLRASLDVWAEGRQLFIANFYFWITGTRMQKTQEGLLQSILHEILRQEPALIPRVVPMRWEQDGLFYENLQPWTLPELYDALETVIREKPAACFCFLIDGLDEYAGDAGEQGLFADKIQQLASSSMVKVCVASRPWTAFENVFGTDPQRMLKVQDLTRDDMDRFVKNTLQENPRFAMISSRDSRALDLVHEIRDSAQGVFLWVVLVVKSLLAGATQEDDVEELTKRLRALPRDLKGFFQRMLDSIDDSYEQHASRILLLAQCATPLPLMAFSWVRVEMKTPDYSVIGRIEQRDDDKRRKHQAKVFLNKWSKDLLVVYDSSSNVDSAEDMADLKIDFLHRSVGEFLKEPDVHSILLAKAGHDFDPHLSICRLLLAETKTMRIGSNPKSTSDSLQALARRLIFHAKQYEDQNHRALTGILQELDNVMTLRLSGFCSSHWTASIEVVHPGKIDFHRRVLSHASSNFLAYAVTNNLTEFVRETLDATPNKVRKSGRPLLDFALYPSFPKHDQPDHLVDNDYPEQMIKMLLERGSSPNQCASVVGAMTVWQMFLLDTRTNRKYTQKSTRAAGAWPVVQLLLKHGADPKVRVPVGEKVSGVVLMQDLEVGTDLRMQRTTTEEVGLVDCLQWVADPEDIEDFIARLPAARSGFWWAFLPWRA